MRKLIIIFSFCNIFIALVACTETVKKQKDNQKSVEVKMEKIDAHTVKATVTVVENRDGKTVELEEVFEGTEEAVKEKIEAFTQTDEAKVGKMEKKVVKKMKFSLEARSGSNASGMVTFTEAEGQVSMEAHINGLRPGTHAIHIHEKADCSAADGTSSGGHWNPTFEQHGAWGAETGFHRGDIGNFEADEKGHGMVSFSTDLWCLGCEDENKDLMGKAVIVHQGADDLTSQPSGAAGARVSCSGIIR